MSALPPANQAMLAQAVANLQALDAQMREFPYSSAVTATIQCWRSTLVTAIADLQNVGETPPAATPVPPSDPSATSNKKLLASSKKLLVGADPSALRALIAKVDDYMNRCQLYGPADALRDSWARLKEALVPPVEVGLCINCSFPLRPDTVSNHFAADRRGPTVGPLCDHCADIIQAWADAKSKAVLPVEATPPTPKEER